jgi:hypothetical protein
MLNDSLYGRTACVAIVASLALSSVGCEDRITQENYDLIKIGMTKVDVDTILGGPGERQEVTGTGISAAGIASATRSVQDTYVWKKGHKEISVTFVADRVVGTGKAGF